MYARNNMPIQKIEFARRQRSRVSRLYCCAAASRAACLACLLFLFVSSVLAGEFIVSSATQIAQVMATAQPGDTLTMTSGLWTNQQILFQGNGTSGNPIVLRAPNYGAVTLSGTSKLKIAGNYLIAENLVFQNGNSAPDPVVEFRNGSTESNYCRLTNSSISNYSPSDINTDNKWVSLYGTYNRVDHCSLVGKTNSGTTLVVWLTNHPNYHLIDRNYFGPRPNLGFNGGETIRVGTSDWSTYQSFTTVEYNLFDQCDGEAEIISSKSRRNMYRYNTFTSCLGTLTLRNGDSCTVEGNFFFGNGVPNSGGIRIIGEDQTVINNYVSGTTDNGLRSALSLMNGIPNSPDPLYRQVKRAVVAFNTFVDNQTSITIGAGADPELTLPPLDCTIANNIVYGTHAPLITQLATPINMTWQGNIFYGATLGISPTPAGIQIVDPRMTLSGSDGLRRPNSDSPAINGSAGTYSLVTNDMDGQTRDLQKDIGADEFSGAAITRRPLTLADVGPDSGPPLPIQLAAFTGTALGGGTVQLEWGTISEVNNYGFYVQRRGSGATNWEEIPNSFIAGHGTTNVPQHYSFVDHNASTGRVSYRLKQIDLDGTVHYTEPIEVEVLTGVTEVAPIEFRLMQNYPNPFNPLTTIKYDLPRGSRVKLSLFNILGQEVATIVNGEQGAGYKSVEWNASSFASGVYYYELQAGEFTQTKKLILMK